MAFAKAPSVWLGAGYSLTSHVAGFTTATAGSNITLPQLADSEADPSTGDIREVAFALCDKLYSAQQAQAAGDRPVRMTISKSVQADPVSGNLIEQYTFVFTNSIISQNVAAEPS